MKKLRQCNILTCDDHLVTDLLNKPGDILPVETHYIYSPIGPLGIATRMRQNFKKKMCHTEYICMGKIRMTL